MKIYLCARYSRRDELRRLRERLQQQGHHITSRWLDTTWEQRDEKGSAAAPPEYRAYHAVQDLEDVQAADCLLTITEEPRSGGRGGRHVEFGVALALNKRLLVVGHRENVFHHHPQVEFYSSIEDACQALLAR